MSLLSETDIDYPLTVTVKRPNNTFDADGDYTESFATVIESMTADIQLSIKIRKLISEDKTGISDNTAWIMFCNPPSSIQAQDRVEDGTRTFIVNAVGDWGSHTECLMRLIET